MKRFWWSAGGVTLLIIVVVGLWLYQQRVQWLEGFNAEHQAKALEFRKRGTKLAQNTDQQGCLEEVLTEYNADCRGFDCTVRYGQMLRSCLADARPTPGFCNGVPGYQEKPDENVKYWIYHQCWDRNIVDPGCRLLMKEQQLVCSRIN